MTRSRRRGISLIEVLLALAIFLLALVPLARLSELGMDNALDAAFTNDATRLATSKLAEIEAGVISPDANSSGTFDDEPLWQWQMESTAVGPPNLFAVTVTVSRTRGRSVTVSLAQMVYDARYIGQAGEIPKPSTTSTTSGQ